MPFAHHDDARIYWKLEGVASSALVLLNSIGTDMGLWDAAMPYLLPHFRVLRIDTRGHGASDAPARDYSLWMLAGDVRAVMDDAGFDRAIVAGVSLGGMIAMELALACPDRVAALALICTSATMDAASWADRIAKVRDGGMAAVADLAMGRFLSPTFIAARPEIAATVRRGLLTMDACGYAGAGAAIRDMALVDRLGTIAVPTTVVTGTRDISTPFEGHGAVLAARIAGARMIAIETAHLAPIEAPEAIAGVLRDIVALGETEQ
jgi:3-oxoadipate enol-lactonase/4-carboxymuconolactone decarboxylase